MRKTINNCQQNSQTGELLAPLSSGSNTSDYKLEAIALFKAKKFKEARTIICAQIRDDEYDDMYRFMYDNLDNWSGGDADKENEVILVIRDGLVKDTTCGDREINLSATLCQLEMLTNS